MPCLVKDREGRHAAVHGITKSQTNNNKLYRWLIGKRNLSMQEMQETPVRSLGWEDPLKREMATHSSILV